MTTCKEFYLDDVMAITVIPIAKIDSTSPNSPALSLSKTLTYDFSFVFDTETIVIGLHPVFDGSPLIPIIRTTGKAKDEETDTTAERLHTVTVTCQVDDRDSSVWDDLLTLERTPAHLILTFRDNKQAFVSATDDAYLCVVNRDGAKTSVQIKIQNLMGIQLLV